MARLSGQEAGPEGDARAVCASVCVRVCLCVCWEDLPGRLFREGPDLWARSVALPHSARPSALSPPWQPSHPPPTPGPSFLGRAAPAAPGPRRLLRYVKVQQPQPPAATLGQKGEWGSSPVWTRPRPPAMASSCRRGRPETRHWGFLGPQEQCQQAGEAGDMR